MILVTSLITPIRAQLVSFECVVLTENVQNLVNNLILSWAHLLTWNISLLSNSALLSVSVPLLIAICSNDCFPLEIWTMSSKFTFVRRPNKRKLSMRQSRLPLFLINAGKSWGAGDLNTNYNSNAEGKSPVKQRVSKAQRLKCLSVTCLLRCAPQIAVLFSSYVLNVIFCLRSFSPTLSLVCWWRHNYFISGKLPVMYSFNTFWKVGIGRVMLGVMWQSDCYRWKAAYDFIASLSHKRSTQWVTLPIQIELRVDANRAALDAARTTTSSPSSFPAASRRFVNQA